MYNTREAMAYRGQLPIQQGQQQGVTPQLLDLLALQKVDSDKKAAAQALALASGTQAMPTVAQGLEQQAMQSARTDIAQKLGLPGLMQSQPQQPQQGQATQAPPPPSGQPSQGLAGAPSNLPKAYRGGGIVAFAEGGGTTEEGTTEGAVTEADRITKDLIARGMAPDVAKDVAGRMIPPRPEMSAEAKEFGTETRKSILSGLKDKSAERAAAAGSDYDIGAGAARLENIATQKEGIAKLAALQEARKAERPSKFWETIAAIGAKGPNVQPGQWGAGVAGAVQTKREGYATQDIEAQSQINKLNDAMAKAIDENNIGRVNMIHAAKVEAYKAQGMSQRDATAMADTDTRTLAGEQTAWENARSREYTTAENIKSREFTAEENRASRTADLKMRLADINQRAREAAGIRADTKEAAIRAGHEKQAMALAAAAAQKELTAEEDIVKNPKRIKGLPLEERVAATYPKFLALLTGTAPAPSTITAPNPAGGGFKVLGSRAP